MEFGFHIPVELPPDSDGNLTRASSAVVKFVEGFMTDRHVPGWIIADMERAGPNNVAAVSAIELAEQNLLTGLLDGDAPVTLNRAKWLWVQKWVARRAGYSNSIPTVYRAIASQAAFVVDHYANTLYEMARRRDFDLFDYSASTMMSELAADAVAAADDSTLASYIEFCVSPARSPGQDVRLERLPQFPRSQDIRRASARSRLFATAAWTGVRSPSSIRQRIQMAGSRVFGGNRSSWGAGSWKRPERWSLPTGSCCRRETAWRRAMSHRPRDLRPVGRRAHR